MRVAVFGVSGSGKSTLARRLAAALGVPHVELDAINWQAGWRDLNTHDLPEFRRRVALAVAAEGWVSDGNYGRVRDLVLDRATHVIWLDYPRSLVMRRVLWRSLRRAVTRREIWPGTGNREAFRQWLDADHPLRWAWRTYHQQRRAYAALLEDPGLAHLERHRLRHPDEVEPLFRRLLAARERAAAAGVSRKG
ncbi:AAA family ATPase [Roseomonas gilardii subsp. gilardii]|uniref:AAA family ATPase n=1 Tax=Roseomonas gilardii TaxID=257708 RepID=UPI001FFB9558|nr:AAA family ATPase [Roseomonas gilardii]UPG71911.1 AAA family ATPase [Roseomonas gilardii subsp. gilardii]